MPDRLAEIRARLDAATPGPWFHYPGEPWVTNATDEPRIIVATVSPRMTGDNADLIAHAPADIAWLLAEVERLQKRVAMYEVVKS